MMKLNYTDRASIIEQLKLGASVPDLCQEYEVSHTRIYSLKEAFQREGKAALVPKSQRPRTIQNQLAAEQQQIIIDTGLRMPHLTLRAIHREVLKKGVIVCRNSVHRYLKREGLHTRRERFNRLLDIVRLSGLESLTPEQLSACETFYPEIAARHLLWHKSGVRFAIYPISLKPYSKSRKALHITLLQDLHSLYTTAVINDLEFTLDYDYFWQYFMRYQLRSTAAPIIELGLWYGVPELSLSSKNVHIYYDPADYRWTVLQSNLNLIHQHQRILCLPIDNAGHHSNPFRRELTLTLKRQFRPVREANNSLNPNDPSVINAAVNTINEVLFTYNSTPRDKYPFQASPASLWGVKKHTKQSPCCWKVSELLQTWVSEYKK
jgi:transposase